MLLQRRWIFTLALLGTLLLLSLASAVVADGPVVTVTVGHLNAPPGGIIKVPVVIRNASALAGGVICLQYDSTVVHIMDVTEGRSNALLIAAWKGNNSENPGYVKVASFSTYQLGHFGDVSFADLSFKVVGGADNLSALNITVESLFDIEYTDLPYSVTNGSLSVLNITTFDTGNGTYPSVAGVHKGSFMPNRAINVSKLYTYPSTGTGGHTEYVRIWDDIALNATATWSGCETDWQCLTFSQPFTLQPGQTYSYEMRTSSYPQIIHAQTHTTLDGSDITCTSFVDLNGNRYEDWIPAFRLFDVEGAG